MAENRISDNRRILYDAMVQDNYELTDFDDFSKKLDDENIRKALHKQLVDDNFDVGDYDSFSNSIYEPQKERVDIPLYTPLFNPYSFSASEPKQDVADEPTAAKPDFGLNSGIPSIAETTRKKMAQDVEKRQQRDNLASQTSEFAEQIKGELNRRGAELDFQESAEPKFLVDASSNTPSFLTKRMSDPEYRDYSAAQEYLDNARKIINEVNANSNDENAIKKFIKGVGRGLKENILDLNNVSFGAKDTSEELALLQALDASDKGTATPSQEALLDAKAIEMAVQEYYGSDVSRGYKAGQSTAESIPFMVEMALNPLASAGKGISSRLAKYALKKYVGKKTAGKVGKYVATRALPRAVQATGDLLGASGMAATTGAAHTAANALSRMQGDVKYMPSNEEGKVQYWSHTEGEDAPTAFAKAYADTAIQNYSEMLGNYFAPITGKVGQGVSNLLEKVHLGGVNTFLHDVSASDLSQLVSDFGHYSNWNGAIGEYGEEMLGGILNAIVVGDQTLDTAEGTGVFNKDNLIDTALAVGLMSGSMNAAQTIGYPVYKYKAKRDVQKAKIPFNDLFSEAERKNLDKAFNDNDARVAGEALREIVNNDGYSLRQKGAAMEYATTIQKYKGAELFSHMKLSDGSMNPEEVQIEQSYEQGRTLDTAQEMNDAANMLEIQAQEVRRLYGLDQDVDIDSFLGENPLQKALDIRKTDEEAGQIVLNYLNAKATTDGVIEGAQDRIEEETLKANAIIDSRKSDTDGLIHPAKMKLDDRQVYVYSGNVALSDDSTINIAGSDKDIIVIDAVTGKREFATVKDLAVIDAAVDPEAEKQSVKAAIADTISTEVANKLEGILPFNIGDNYPVMDDEGNAHNVQVVAVDDQNIVQVIMDNETQPTTVTKDVIQQMSNAYNLNRAAQFEQGRQEEREAEKMKQETKVVESSNSVEQAAESSAEVVPERVVPTLKDGNPDFNAMDADMFVEEYVSRYGEDSAIKIARKNISNARENIAKIDKKIDDIADPNQMEGLYTQRKKAEAQVARYSDILDRLGASEDANETEVDQKNRLRNEAGNRITILFPDGLPNVESFILADIATGNRIRWSDKVTNGAVTSRGLGAELGLRESAKERARRLPLIGKDAMTPEEYAESLGERLSAVGIRYDESSLRDAVLDVYQSVDSRKGAWDALENISRRAQEPEMDTDWEDMQAQMAYNKAQDDETPVLPDVPDLATIEEEAPIYGEEAAKIEAQEQAEDYKLSDEVDENGRQFVLASNGDIAFGNIDEESGLTPAPILLSEGIITNPATNDGYGLVHIEARHGDQIRNAGYPSVVSFVEEVAKNYQIIKEGKNRNGNNTYMLQLTDKHNNTLMIELSGDGTYWNINTAGIFKTSYGKNRKEVYNRQTTAKQPAEVVETSQSVELNGTQTPPSLIDVSTPKSSESKDTTSEPQKQEVDEKISHEEAKVNTNPTDGQKEAGNYKKGHIKIDGFDITIETPKGVERSGVDEQGNKWSIKMNNTYGYIRGTEGVDGDHIDLFLSDNIDNWNGSVYVIDQVKPDGSFDEHKVMYGFNSIEEAQQAYLANYSIGWQGLGAITGTTKEEFQKWVTSSHRKTKPFAEYKSVNKTEGQAVNTTDSASLTERTTPSTGLDTKEEARRKPLRERAKMWEEKVGVKVNLIESEADIPTEVAKRAVAEGQRVTGWVVDGQVYLYMPYIANRTEIDKTYLHEVVAHVGMKNLLTKEGYKAFCERVFNEVMSDAQREYYLGYPSVKNEAMAADEFIAHLAEDTNMNASVWQKIVRIFRDALRKMGVDVRLTNADIEAMLRDSYKKLVEEREGTEATEDEQILFRSVYHGSGAEFDKFDHSFMGTGEGNQAFGWGTYVTEDENSARAYAQIHPLFYNKRLELSKLRREQSKLSENIPFLKGKALKKATQELEKIKKALTSLSNEANRYLYSVEIPDNDGTNYLEYGKPLSKAQLNNIKRALYNHLAASTYKGAEQELKEELDEVFAIEQDGKDIYDTIGFYLGSDKAASEFLNKNGYVGISYPADGGNAGDARNYVIFNEADLDISDSVRFRSAKPAPVFYSNAEYAIKAVKQEKATPEQWLKMIEKNGGLKAGEDKWLGLSDWLKSSDKKTLTKQEVLDFIKENQIQIEEVEYAENPQGFEELKKEYDGWLRDGGYDYAWDKLIERYGHDSTVAFDDVGGELMVQYGNTASKLLGGEVSTINNTRLGYTTSGLENKREIALTVPTIESWNESDEIHFGDAGNGRAIAWVRFGETTDADGNRVLVIDEVQSKRHQDGREEGYKNPQIEEIIDRIGRINSAMYSEGISTEMHEERNRLNSELEALLENENPVLKNIAKQLNEKNQRLAELQREKVSKEDGERVEIYRLQAKQNEVRNNRDYDYYESEIENLRSLIDNRNEEIKTLKSDIAKLEEEYSRYQRTDIRNASVGVAPAPFEKNWAELAMKRMLRYAAENGFDKIAWTTGEQQADRYDLSKSVDVINAEHNEDGSYNINVATVDDSHFIQENNIPESRLTDLVGKEMALSIVKATQESEDGKAEIEGDNLRIGGSGMKAFYDQMIPSFMNKYGKKWGVKVGEVTMPSLEENNTMHSIDVTDAMRESVMQGQPMFRLSDKTYNKLEGWYDDIATKYNVPGEIVVSPSRQEFEQILLDNGVSQKDLRNYDLAAYIPHKNIFLINGEDIKNNIKAEQALFHEVWHKLTEEIITLQHLKWIADTIPTGRLTELNNSFWFGKYKRPIDIIDELISYSVEFYFEAEVDIDNKPTSVFEAYLKNHISLNEATDLAKALLPELAKEYSDILDKVFFETKRNLIAYKNQYYGRNEAPKENISRNRRGNTLRATAVPDKKLLTGEAQVAKGAVRKNATTRAERQKAIINEASDLASSLGVKLNVIEDVNEITDSNTRRQRAKRGAKAWYDVNTDQVYFVAPNATSIADAQESVLHEVVAHKGLRDVVGRENFKKFLDRVYQSAAPEIRTQIIRLAAQNGWDIREATEEYLASLAEQGFDSRENRTFLQKVRDLFMDMLREAKIVIGYNITDNDMRYMLWRTYQMQKSQGAMAFAEDVLMQQKLGVGNFRTRPMTEEEQIIADAKANGTYLKAPNGNDTNLTPKRWAQVRTKAFKKWFGDWEKAARIEKLRKSKDAEITGNEIEASEDLKEYKKNAQIYGRTLQGEYINTDTGAVISLQRGRHNGGINEVLQHNYKDVAHLQSVAAIPQIIENGIYIESRPNKDTDTNPDVKEYQMFVCGLKIGGEDYTVLAKVAVDSKGNRYYDHNLVSVEKGKLIDIANNEQSAVSSGFGTTPDTKSTTNSQRKYKELISLLQTNSSKVVDANGEPMVVYHYSDIPNITIFNPFRHKEDISDAENIKLKAIRDAYKDNGRSLTRPFMGIWATPIRGEYAEYGQYEYELFANIRKPKITNRVSPSLTGIKGADGVFSYSNDVLMEVSTTLPERFKSATDNVGTFGPNNDDIRFRSTPKPSTPSTGIARKQYDEAVRKRIEGKNNVGRFENIWHHFRESYQDSMLAVKELYNAILNETGKKLQDYEDVYKAENRLSSTNKAQIEAWERDHMKPLQKEILSLIQKGTNYNDIIDYLFAKHGIERNKVLAERDAEQMATRWEQKRKAGAKQAYDFEHKRINRSYGGMIAALSKKRGTGEITQEYYDSEVAKLEKRRDKELASLEKKYNRIISNIEQDKATMYEKALLEVIIKDYSGLTELTGEEENFNQAAQKMVDSFEKEYDTTKLWEAINKATNATLRKSFDSGMMNKETYDKTVKMFKYYIPLRGWDNSAAADQYEYMSNVSMKILPALKTAKGRTSRADDPIATIGSMGESSIIQGNRNLMKQKLLNFAQNNPTSLLTIGEQWYVKQPDGTWVENNPVIPIDATGEEVDAIVKQHEADMIALGENASKERNKLNLGLHATTWEGQEHTIKVKRNGKEYLIFVNGNPIAAQAINGFTNPNAQNGWIIKSAQAIKNFMARAFTSNNPVFIFDNLRRDLIWAGTAVAIKEDKKYIAQYTKNIGEALVKAQIPRLLSKWQKGTLDTNNPLERYFKEFIENGGETGFTQLNTVDDYKRNMKRFIKEAQSGAAGMPKKAWRTVMESIEFLNRSAEDTTRFAVYMTSRQMGRSIAESISNAKDITVNFNKKGRGEYGATFMNYAYIFFNAAIQSLNNFGSLLKHHPKKTSVAITTFASAGLIAPMLSLAVQAMLSDDDDEPTYWDLPEWVRRNNIVLYAPFTSSGYFTIPLPHELRPFYGMGELAFAALNGKETVENALAKSIEGFAGLLPFDFTGNAGNMMVNFTPTIAQPIAQLVVNRDFFGTPIYRDTAFNKLDPGWTKAYKGTNQMLVDATEFINELSGGDAVKSGMIDINPAIVEHIFESYLGGMGKTLNRTAKTFSMLWNEDMREWRNVPFISNIYIESDERTSGSQVNREYFDALGEAELVEHLFNGYKQRARMGAMEYAEKIKDLMQSDVFKRFQIAKGKMKAISNLNSKLKEVSDPTDKENIETIIMNLKVDMLTELEELESSNK